jgi:hypothetical protein
MLHQYKSTTMLPLVTNPCKQKENRKKTEQHFNDTFSRPISTSVILLCHNNPDNVELEGDYMVQQDSQAIIFFPLSSPHLRVCEAPSLRLMSTQEEGLLIIIMSFPTAMMKIKGTQQSPSYQQHQCIYSA